jgi:UDP-glucose 4-epimerase
MRCVVTGGLGFVGSNVVRMLAVQGHDVLAVGRSEPDAWIRRLLRGVEQHVAFRIADLGTPGALAQALNDDACDVVIHAAVITATTAQVERDEALSIVNVNVNGTMEALDLARRKESQRFVYLSSPSAIGPVAAEKPLDEDVVPQPNTIYGITKLASEQLVRRYGEIHSLSAASARIAQPYGPGERATPSRPRTSPIYEWLEAAARDEVVVSGPPHVERDWTWIEETAQGIALLALAPQLRHDLYHLSRGRMTAVGEVIAILRDTYPTLRIDERPDAPGLNPNIAGLARRWPLDSSRFNNEFGWSPTTSIVDGMRAYLAWNAGT